MKTFKAANGQTVTNEMLNRWSEALDRDEWPQGEYNDGGVIIGRPPLSVGGSSVLSVKLPTAMKRAIESNAKSVGVSTSDYVREVLAKELMAF